MLTEVGQVNIYIASFISKSCPEMQLSENNQLYALALLSITTTQVSFQGMMRYSILCGHRIQMSSAADEVKDDLLQHRLAIFSTFSIFSTPGCKNVPIQPSVWRPGFLGPFLAPQAHWCFGENVVQLVHPHVVGGQEDGGVLHLGQCQCFRLHKVEASPNTLSQVGVGDKSFFFISIIFW